MSQHTLPFSRISHFLSGIFGRKKRYRYFDLEGSDYEVLEPIRHEEHSSVFSCRDVVSGQIVDVKQVTIFRFCEDFPNSPIDREISILEKLDHVNVIKLQDVVKKKDSTYTYAYLVFEHVNYDLHHYIRDRNIRKDPMTRKRFLYQILSAVAHCHSHKILHRNLKPENLLIDDSRKIIKLADFSSAAEMPSTTTIPTTRWYRAPEIFLDSSQYSSPSDLWSVGCVFAEMVFGYPIFQAPCCADELEAIFRVLGTPTEETWPGVTTLSRHLGDYAKFKPLGLSRFVGDLEPEGLDLLSMMLCLDPSKRISAKAALNHSYFDELNLVQKQEVKSLAAKQQVKLITWASDLEQLGKPFSPGGEQLGKFIGWRVAQLGELIGWRVKQLGELVGWIVKLPGKLIACTLEQLGKLIGWVAETLGKLIDWVAETLEDLIILAMEQVGDLIIRATEQLGNFINWAVTRLEKLIIWIAERLGKPVSWP